METFSIHQKMTNIAINSLRDKYEIKPSKNKWVDFIMDDKNAHVNAHKLVGRKKKYVVMEYANDKKSDKQSPIDIEVFVIPGEEKLYFIKKCELYNQVDQGIQNNRFDFKITNTGDVLRNSGLCISIELNTFRGLKGMKTVDKAYEERIISMRDKDKLVKQYEPLVIKITKQFVSKVQYNWEDVKSMAYEGLAIAINTYDEKRSNMTFLQFAAFAIRNNILTSLDNELRTVKMSAYAQKLAKENGEASFSSVSMTTICGESGSDDRDVISREYKNGLYEDANFQYGDIYKYIYHRINSEFPERDCQMFYMSFGINGYEQMKGKEIAKLLNVSEGLVSQKVKKMISFIRKDNDLCEMLANL